MVWRVGVWLAVAAVTMLFVGFTSAYLVRRTAADWTGRGPLPALLWVNTALLVLSSAALEWGRWGAAAGRLRAGLWAAGTLGLFFVAGQMVVWRQLVQMGVFLRSNPHSSFFYVLTAVHALHVIVALAWLAYAAARVSRWQKESTHPPPSVSAMVGAASTFWHFMAGLWVFLFLLLFAW